MSSKVPSTCKAQSLCLGLDHKPRSYTAPSLSSSYPSYRPSPPSPLKRKIEPEIRMTPVNESRWLPSSSSSGPNLPYSGPPRFSPSPNFAFTSHHSGMSPPAGAGNVLGMTSHRHSACGAEYVQNPNRPKSPEIPKPSHLPPTLAALALTRPVNPVNKGAASSTLPSLSLGLSAEPMLPAFPMGRRRSEISRDNQAERLPNLRDIFGDRPREHD